MQLICDDVNNIYVWVEDDDENVELSPHFDYEEDGLLWKERMAQLLKEKNVSTK
jgi:hypothetical protein